MPLALLAVPAGAQGNVIVLGPTAGPGIDTSDPQTAVSLAQDGDTILVKPGDYPGVLVIDGKSLTVVADQGSPPKFQNVFVSNLAAGQRVTLQGLRIRFGIGSPLTISANAGQVWLENVEVTSSGVGEAVRIITSSSVVCHRVVAFGGVADPVFGLAGGGVTADNSRLYVYDSILLGGDGELGDCSPPFWTDGGPGTPGITLDDSFLFVSGSILQGGDGGGMPLDYCLSCPPAMPGVGEHGVVMLGARTELWTLDSTLVGGTGGSGGPSCPGGGTAPGFVGSGTVTELTGPSLAMRVSSPVRELGSLDVTLTGPAGNSAFLAFGLDTADAFLPVHKGALLVALAGPLVSLGPLSASGMVTLSLPAPLLPAGFDSMVFFGQSAFVDPSALAVIGEPASVLVLDQAF